MIKEKTTKSDVGVIIARFQTPYLHNAHKELINFVRNENDKTIVLLGLSPLKATYNNPLDFDSRRKMIEDEFDDIVIGYVDDNPDDNIWSYY